MTLERGKKGVYTSELLIYEKAHANNVEQKSGALGTPGPPFHGAPIGIVAVVFRQVLFSLNHGLHCSLRPYMQSASLCFFTHQTVICTEFLGQEAKMEEIDGQIERKMRSG